MLDFLFALGQFLCLIGLFYGLVLTIAHGDCVDTMRAQYDPIVGHEWLIVPPVRAQQALARRLR